MPGRPMSKEMIRKNRKAETRKEKMTLLLEKWGYSRLSKKVNRSPVAKGRVQLDIASRFFEIMQEACSKLGFRPRRNW